MNILYHILLQIYPSIGTAFIIACMFSYICHLHKNHNVKVFFKEWRIAWKENPRVKYYFFFSFYAVLILLQTILCRSYYADSLKYIMGNWSIFNSSGELNNHILDNILLFIPYTPILFITFGNEIFNHKRTLFKIFIQSFFTSCLFSAVIELSQAIFHLGTLQISDWVYNTLGGILGGFIYWICYRIQVRLKRKAIRNG